MDLLKVKVENFRCFEGTHEVDMTEGPLWVVRGENGSGKSTLVCDSILFALFNTIPSLEGTQSLRKTDLINLKYKTMYVQIWFNHNGNRYSIRRSYRVKGKSDTLYHQFEVWENNKELINTPKQDDARIFVTEKFWEIEDFRNTTIILQKEITNSLDQRESDRKKSIEKIFNIERFAKMSELAHRHARDTATEIKIVSNSLEEISKMIVDEQELQERKFTTQEKIKSTTNQKNTAETSIKKAKAVKENLDKFVLQGANLKEKISQKNLDLKKNEIEKQTLVEELNNIETDLSKETELITKLKDIEKLETALEEINKKLDLVKSKEKEIDSYTKLIKNKEKNLQTELNQLEKSKTLLEKQYHTSETELKSLLEKEESITTLSEIVSKLPDFTKSKEVLQQELDKAEVLEKTIYSKEKDLEIIKKRVKDQLDELDKKITKMKSFEEEKLLIEDEISKNKIVGKQLEQETENLEELQEKEQELKNSIFKVAHEIETYNQKIKELHTENNDFKTLDVQGVCPKCKQKLNEKHINDITQENNEKINNLEQKIASDNTIGKEFQNNLESITKELQKKKKSNQKLEEIINAFKLNKLKLASINKQITVLNEEMKNFQEIKIKADKNELFNHDELELTQLKKQQPDIQKLKTQVKDFDSKIIRASKSESQLLEIQNQLKKKPEIKTLLNSLSTDIESLNKQIISKKENLNSKHFTMEEIKILEELKQQVDSIKKELPDVENTKKELQLLEPDKTRSNLKFLEKQKGVKEEKIERIKSIDIVLKSISKDIKDFETQLSQMDLDKIVPDVEKYKNEIETLEKQLTEIIMNLGKLGKELENIAEQVAKNNQYMNDKKKKSKEYEILRNKKDDYELLETTFKDIGKRILNRVMSRINIYSTEILSRLGNEQLEQITLVESKHGFELKIVSAGEERYPNWFSGGQKVRIGLAFRLSLSKTLAEVTGGDIETIMIDEGDFGALDEYGLRGVAEILNDLKNFFKRMVIVTHMDHLANELDGRRILIKESKIIQETIS